MTLGQMLAQTAERLPNKTAIRFRDQETTYADFDKRANQVANGLIALGVAAGRPRGALAAQLPLFMEAYYGILKAGAAVVPMNVLYKPAEIEYIVKDSGAKALLTLAPFAPQALQAAANAPELQKVIVASPEEMPGAAPLARRVRPGVRGRRRTSRLAMEMSPSFPTLPARQGARRARC